jgi:hypothetical protein
MQPTDFSFRRDLPILAGPVEGCQEDNTINDQTAMSLFPNGISFSDFDLNDKQRIPPEVLAAKMTMLAQRKLIPANLRDVDTQIGLDTTFYESVRREYCWYENRYQYLLKKYLRLLMSDNREDVQISQSMNMSVTDLNKRLQSLLEIMNNISNARAQRVDSFRGRHVDGNMAINSNLDKLATLKKKLNSDNLRLTTQREMQRYTEEKNRALRLQITVFAVLNVVALGVVYTAYKQSA